jgi:hypothetical protein
MERTDRQKVMPPTQLHAEEGTFANWRCAIVLDVRTNFRYTLLNWGRVTSAT